MAPPFFYCNGFVLWKIIRFYTFLKSLFIVNKHIITVDYVCYGFGSLSVWTGEPNNGKGSGEILNPFSFLVNPIPNSEKGNKINMGGALYLWG